MSARFRGVKVEDRVVTVGILTRVLSGVVEAEVTRQLSLLGLRPPLWVRIRLALSRLFRKN